MQVESFAARDYVAPDLLPPELIDALTGIVTARYADRGLIFSDHTFYRAALLGDAVVSQTAFDAVGMGGRVGLTAAQMDLWNGDRALDAIAAQGRAMGRTATIRTVGAASPSRSDAGGDLGAAETAFAGVVAGLSTDGQRMRLTLDDLSWRLSKPLQANLYGGTGGLDGGADLLGKPKPVSFGWRYNVGPVYLGQVDLGDGSKHTYQTHWRTIAAHDAVRERGVAMSVTTGVPGVGQWKDWPAIGCFQIGFSPNGAITCDVRGDAVGYYAASTVQILQRMLSSLGPVFTDAEFDLPSLGLVETQILGEAGWGVSTDPISAADAVQQIAGQQGIWVIGNRSGKLRTALPYYMGGGANLSLDLGDIVSLRPVAVPVSLQPTPATVEMVAGRNWSPLTDISSSATAAERMTLAGKGRVVRRTSSLITGRQFQARTASPGGLFRYDVDAQRVADNLLGWMENGLRAFEVTTDKYLRQIEIGHVARVTYPLFGLEGGFTGVVAAWSEQSRRQRVTMTLVG